MLMYDRARNHRDVTTAVVSCALHETQMHPSAWVAEYSGRPSKKTSGVADGPTSGSSNVYRWTRAVGLNS